MRYLLFTLFIGSTACAQPLSDAQKLSSLCHICGFLKYYHPAVSTGKLDWDQRLVTLLPAVQQAQDLDALSAIYEQLLTELEPVKPCRQCQLDTDLPAAHRRNFDLSFLADSTALTATVRARLTYLKTNRNQDDNYYVQQVKGVNNTTYEHEKPYADMALPNESYRLLALFRYWNIIHYFFPYKYAIGTNWNEVLTTLIPVFRQAYTEQSYQIALYQLVAAVHDSHGFLETVDKSRCLRCDLGTYWLPITVQLIDNKAIITGSYADSTAIPSSIRLGTVVSKIDGISIQERINTLRSTVAASNEAALLRDIKHLICVGPARQATLTISQNGRDTVVAMSRLLYSEFDRKYAPKAPIPVSKWLTDSIGYVNMGVLTSPQVDSVMQPLLTAKTIIFDLRNYPKGTYWLVKRYLTGQSNTFAQFTGPDLRFPGVFVEMGGGKLFGPVGNRFMGKVLVLVNEETQSHAEFTAMAFRTYPNTVLVGSPTAGADGNVSWVPLPGGYRTAFSGIGVYYPDGRETQRVGIVPDVLVKPTAEGIWAGRDEVLERAIELAHQR